MSSNVSPASATAASHASMVSDSGGTISLRPIFDMPIPVIAECSSNFSFVSIGRTYLPKSCGAISSTGCGPVLFSAVGLKSGSQTAPALSSSFSNSDLDGLAELEFVGLALNDVGGQPNPRVLDDGDLGHHVRRREVGKAEAVVDGEGRQGGFARYVAHTHVGAAAVPAYRLRADGSTPCSSGIPGCGAHRRRPRSRRTRSAAFSCGSGRVTGRIPKSLRCHRFSGPARALRRRRG